MQAFLKSTLWRKAHTLRARLLSRLAASPSPAEILTY